METSLQQERVRVCIIGGGIHGVGVLHDLVSRGWKDVVLLEKKRIASGTSSRSTKLIHGGLRYLERISDFPLVFEGLKERKFLHQVASDIVQPLKIYLPLQKQTKTWGFKVRVGLKLYDWLAGGDLIGGPSARVSADELKNVWPMLDTAKFKACFSFWDGQTDDVALVTRVRDSAIAQGGKIYEQAQVTRVEVDEEQGFRIIYNTETGDRQVNAKYVVNCAGPWAHRFLSPSLCPKISAVNVKGSHLLLKDMGLKHGFLFEDETAARIFFCLPWQGYTLVGTTESEYAEHPDQVRCTDEDVDYLLQQTNRYLKDKISTKDITATFAGLRWLNRESGQSLHGTSRGYLIHEEHRGQNVMFTLYGGKLTAYRVVAEKIGDLITTHFGVRMPSGTHSFANWAKPGTGSPDSVLSRFEMYR